MFKEAESRPDKIESTSNNVQVRKKQQHRRRACDLLASLKRFYLHTTVYNVLNVYVPSKFLKWPTFVENEQNCLRKRNFT